MIKVTFHLPYLAHGGEKIYLCFSNANETGFLPTVYDNQGNWEISLSLNSFSTSISWYYRIVYPTGEEEREGGPARFLSLSSKKEGGNFRVYDFWRAPGDLASVFSTLPFQETFFYRDGREPEPIDPVDKTALVITSFAPTVGPEEEIYLTGDTEALGNWDPVRALPLKYLRQASWEIRLPHPLPKQFEYKYLIRHREKGTFSWEEGPNRLARLHEGEVTIINDWPLVHPGSPKRWAGIIVPVFSLRSSQGLGVGEFLDLIPLIDWASRAGLKVVSLLPINDTQSAGTWADSYPYAITSTTALHPLYLNLDALIPPRSGLIYRLKREKRRLNKRLKVDYPEVMRLKMELLKEIYSEHSPTITKDPEFISFVEENAEWLKPYAAFSYLREKSGGKSLNKWGPYHQGTEKVVEELTDPTARHYPDIAFHYFVQFHLYRQLLSVVNHARERGIILKGDLPIGVSRMSVEMWSHPEWFMEDYSAGAPADDFSNTGQNWGFPLYNWEEMEKDGFLFWRRRFRHISKFFQAVRLDHVLGYFRIWAIPAEHITASQGRFMPSLPFSREELLSRGITDPDCLATPLITERTLRHIFGRSFRKIVPRYLRQIDGNRYEFLSPYSSPLKVWRLWRGKRKRPILEGLLRLHDEVLLLPEKRDGGIFFHPRFRMSDTFRFHELTEEMRDSLLKLSTEYFYHRHNDLWRQTGNTHLRLLQGLSNILLCAEDLGMVPEIVPPLLTRRGILSLRIQRMPTRPGEIFSLCQNYPYLSVACPSTHDMQPLRLWWEETDRALIQFYFEHILHGDGIAPLQLTEELAEAIIEQHLSSPSMFALFLLQDLLSLDGSLRRKDCKEERINDPAILHHRWNFRFHLKVEELLNHRAFQEKIRNLVRRSGREN